MMAFIPTWNLLLIYFRENVSKTDVSWVVSKY